MPKFHVSKSILINAPVDTVYQNIRDLNQWIKWSPWMVLEPEAKVTVAGDNRSYSWEGKRMGSGNMTVTDEQRDQWVTYDLVFLKPFKSQADVRLTLESKAKGTEVSWDMNSSLPWFLFFMKKMMVAFLGADFQRGLLMLKDHSEDGKVNSRLDFKGRTTYPGCSYIGIKTACTIDEVGEKMRKDFERLHIVSGELKDLVSGQAFSIYHHWDIVNGKVVYTAALSAKNIPENLPQGIVSGSVPETPVNTVRHTGPYLHLGNAWSAQYSMQRNKEFKFNKKIHPFETYANEQSKVAENELITEVHFPVK